MAVTSIEELNRLVQQDWIPYFHKGVRRWYVRRGQARRIIDVRLEPYAEDLAARIPRRRNEVTSGMAAEVVERRRRGELISSISEELGIPYRTVENIIDRYESGTLEAAETGVAPGSKPNPPSEESLDLPKEVEGYVRRLRLKVVGKPEKRPMPGYGDREGYAIPIEDAETGERLRIVYPLPTYRDGGYETVTATNMEGEKVRVVALRGEELQSGNPFDPLAWPLLALGVAFGVGVGATLLDKFLGPTLGWNPEGRWWWERALSFA